ncbi:hypothetical protein PG997_000357 [Apiospora hydei]|uniref:Uncharacterized protein n=1 Tax=Apiospora hydei TaxID=1337664 RepID=A0ABR1XAJ0_9PEZI
MEEKAQQLDSPRSVCEAGQGRLHQRRLRTVLAASLTGTAALGYLSGLVPYVDLAPLVGSGESATQLSQEWKWADIQPSRDLKWQKCYESKFDCARLDVPLDWQDPSEKERVVLAVIRSKAKTQKDYKGPVFLNPGGPGGSGLSWVLEQGDALQAIVGDNHDIISWDPRGIGASVPNVECWGSSWKRHDWGLRKVGVADAYPGVVHDAFAQFDGLSRQCEAYTNKTAPGLLQHISTAYHARDMLEISKKAGYDQVRYWGISYGTILGGTFASLFPGHVERLVSDGKSRSSGRIGAELIAMTGNVDYGDWFPQRPAQRLRRRRQDHERLLHRMPPRRPRPMRLPQRQRDGPIRPRGALLGFAGDAAAAPVLLPAHANATDSPAVPQLVTYSALQRLIRTVLYKPLYEFPELARVLAALEAGRVAILPHGRIRRRQLPHPRGLLAAHTATIRRQRREHGWWRGGGTPTDFSVDAFGAIACADGAPLTDETPESFQLYVDDLVGRVSRPGGGDHKKNLTVTNFPILFIGNTADNVTPLRSSYNNSAAFPGSVVLVQRSYGHASVAAPSTCSARAIRAYFQNGTLPAPGTHCDQDFELFEDPPTPAVRVEDDETDDGLALAVSELSRKADLSGARARRRMAGIMM